MEDNAVQTLHSIVHPPPGHWGDTPDTGGDNGDVLMVDRYPNHARPAVDSTGAAMPLVSTWSLRPLTCVYFRRQL